MTGVAYVESSALTKLVLEERESAALRSFLADRGRAASELSVTEVLRAVRRADNLAAAGAVDAILKYCVLLPVDRSLLRRAALLEPIGLRSLDSIHLATVLSMAEEIDVLVTYDNRLREAAIDQGIKVESPA